eukprot:CAMPEP_0118906414 /NCGR_PEP_ID=MMETSP1166-20130328/10138_1 /TAXON_ID=1104430 /ORGANISM="Chrysoreinhardia sp, Strain CCMP3193" /LENGTH=998 /DNA_ID=CAMNT_0006845723 /DNA_START=1 /DNA_END=2997 /DNA_ORIENTATION=-
MVQLSGVALKRGRYKGVWRSRYFELLSNGTLRYWESEAAMLLGPPRGELEVFGAFRLNIDDHCERPFAISIHVSVPGTVGGVLRAAGVPSREEWIALRSAEERDEWLGALRSAGEKRHDTRFTRGSHDDERFEPDDSLWADVTGAIGGDSAATSPSTSHSRRRPLGDGDNDGESSSLLSGSLEPASPRLDDDFFSDAKRSSTTTTSSTVMPHGAGALLSAVTRGQGRPSTTTTGTTGGMTMMTGGMMTGTPPSTGKSYADALASVATSKEPSEEGTDVSLLTPPPKSVPKKFPSSSDDEVSSALKKKSSSDDDGFHKQDALEKKVTSAVVYDYSIVRTGWRVVATFHLQAASSDVGEPWTTRRTHAELRLMLADMGREDLRSALDRKNNNASDKSSPLLGRRVERVNRVLKRLVDEASGDPRFRAFLAPATDKADDAALTTKKPPPKQQQQQQQHRMTMMMAAKKKGGGVLAARKKKGLPATGTTTTTFQQQLLKKKRSTPGKSGEGSSSLRQVLDFVPSPRTCALLASCVVFGLNRAYEAPFLLLLLLFVLGVVVGAESSRDAAPPSSSKKDLKTVDGEDVRRLLTTEDVLFLDDDEDAVVVSSTGVSQHLDDDDDVVFDDLEIDEDDDDDDDRAVLVGEDDVADGAAGSPMGGGGELGGQKMSSSSKLATSGSAASLRQSLRKAAPAVSHDISLPRWPSLASGGSHCWSEPDASFFRTRSTSYLVDRVKAASAPSLFTLANVDLFLTDDTQQHVARHPNAFVAKHRTEYGRLFVVNFCMPWGNLVGYWNLDAPPPRRKKKKKKGNTKQPHAVVSDGEDEDDDDLDGSSAALSDDDDDDTTDDSRRPRGVDDDEPVDDERNDDLDDEAIARDVFERFIDGDDNYRDNRLKMIPRVVEGNWIVRRAVGGGNNAAKLAEGIKLTYFSGPDYFEVDVDIVGSPLARRILSVARSATSTLVLDLAFVIEGVERRELPERILGAVRIHRVDPDKAPLLEPID